ncbi:hypothetical protein [Oceanicella sp. SM1341]|uniref:hypothetical protein n=1 Tax=Oceanicella sp. SM1341 TaxID=1548889 RepID=UPI00130090BB|nr:hypothetical protein [Oceanicella sp. SM1341]
MSLTVAHGELTRVLPWAIRALGYAFGTADRAARLVTDAAAVDPALLDRIATAAPRAAGTPRWTFAEGCLHYDAAGLSLLEAGPAVMDFLAARAGEAPVVEARLTAAAEPFLLGAALLAGAAHGLSVVALAEGGWQAAAGTRLATGRGAAALSGPLGEAASRRAAAPGAEIVILAAAAPGALGLPQDARDTGAALAEAFARGIPVSAETLAALYALETVTWAPTSERSRAQAGFTPRPVPAS